MNTFIRASRLFLGLTILTGIIYPMLITGVAQTVFAKKAEGSLIERDGKVVGSALIAQKFENERYFWPRPSATDYNPQPSGGSNLGPTAKKLKDQVDAAKSKLGTDAPQDLIFASASGLDPDISTEAAAHQVARVAKARGLSENQVQKLVERQTTDLQFQFLGQRRVNVLLLNLALDDLEVGETR